MQKPIEVRHFETVHSVVFKINVQDVLRLGFTGFDEALNMLEQSVGLAGSSEPDQNIVGSGFKLLASLNQLLSRNGLLIFKDNFLH